MSIVTGTSSGMGREFVKQLPHSLIMSVWLSQQKKAKNSKGLTAK